MFLCYLLLTGCPQLKRIIHCVIWRIISQIRKFQVYRFLSRVNVSSQIGHYLSPLSYWRLNTLYIYCYINHDANNTGRFKATPLTKFWKIHLYCKINNKINNDSRHDAMHTVSYLYNSAVCELKLKLKTIRIQFLCKLQTHTISFFIQICISNSKPSLKLKLL